MKIEQRNQRGFTLIELVVAVAIFMIILSGIAALVSGTYLDSFENEKRLQAQGVLAESWEALRAIRNHDWADITNGTHGLRSTNGYWEFYGTSDETDGITRQITVSSVLRDTDGIIVDSGGEDDSDSKKITIALSWDLSEGKSQSVNLETYLHNYSSPAVWPPPPPEPPPEP